MNRLALLVAFCGGAVLPQDSIPMTGIEQPLLAAFDREVLRVMNEVKSAGAVLAVVRNEKLVLARGYGYADRETGRPMEPEAPIRVASVSKALTAIALDGLIAEGKIALDRNVFQDLLPHLMSATPADPRFRDIQVGHLASHTAGLTGDLRCNVADMVRVLDSPSTPMPQDLTRYFSTVMRLRAAPGAPYEYNNPGYGILGRAMEAAADEPLETLIRRLVFDPLGLKRPRLARTRLADLSTGETMYPDSARDRVVLSIFPNETQPRPMTHGGCPLESMDALGGWAVSPIDLALTYAALPGASIEPVADGSGGFRLTRLTPYAFFGFHVEGNGTVVRRLANGTAYALTFNSSQVNGAPSPEANTRFDTALMRLMRETSEWPDVDLAPTYLEKWSSVFPVTTAGDELRWTGAEGAAVRDKLRIRLEGPEGMPFRLHTAALWLRFSARSGVLPAEIEVWPDTNGLRAGPYLGNVLVEHATEIGDPVVIPARLQLHAPASTRAETLRVRPVAIAPVSLTEDVTVALAADGGKPPYRWTIAPDSNPLPAGLALDAATGRLTGRPRAEGRSEFVVLATDAAGMTAERGLTLSVNVPGNAGGRLEQLTMTTQNATSCAPPPGNTNAFRRTDPRITAHVRYNASLVAGDQMVFEWIAPGGGAVRQRNVWNSNTTWGVGTWGTSCVWQILQPSQHVAVASGEWTLRVTWNGHPLVESKFRLE